MNLEYAYYEYGYQIEELLEGFSGMGGFGSALGLISYVFSAFAIYTIAQRREIKKAWLAWVPVLNVWILGSISDQYRYVVKEQVKSKRKVLLILSLINAALSLAATACLVGTGISGINALLHNASQTELGRILLNGVLTALAVCLPLLILSLIAFVFRAIALYDLYTSCEPRNNALYLILSLIPGISRVTRPLFLFLCRDKDEGMPPRREDPAAPVFDEPEDYQYTEL